MKRLLCRLLGYPPPLPDPMKALEPFVRDGWQQGLTEGQRVLATLGPTTGFQDEFPETATGQVPCVRYFSGEPHRYHVYRPADHGPVSCPGLGA